MAQSNSLLTFIVAFVALLFSFLVMLYAWNMISRYLYEKNFSPFASIMITFLIFFIMIGIGYYIYFKSISSNYYNSLYLNNNII